MFYAPSLQWYIFFMSKRFMKQSRAAPKSSILPWIDIVLIYDWNWHYDRMDLCFGKSNALIVTHVSISGWRFQFLICIFLWVIQNILTESENPLARWILVNSFFAFVYALDPLELVSNLEFFYCCNQIMIKVEFHSLVIWRVFANYQAIMQRLKQTEIKYSVAFVNEALLVRRSLDMVKHFSFLRAIFPVLHRSATEYNDL